MLYAIRKFSIQSKKKKKTASQTDHRIPKYKRSHTGRPAKGQLKNTKELDLRCLNDDAGIYVQNSVRLSERTLGDFRCQFLPAVPDADAALLWSIVKYGTIDSSYLQSTSSLAEIFIRF